MIFSFVTDDPELLNGLEFITNLATELNKLRTENEKKDKTIESLVKDKYTKYGNGSGFLANDGSGQTVWVNSIDIELKQKDEEIAELQTEIKKLREEKQ